MRTSRKLLSLLFCLVLFTDAILFSLCIYGFQHPYGFQTPQISFICFGVGAAQIGLIPLWLVWGPSQPLVRHFAALLFVVVSCSLTTPVLKPILWPKHIIWWLIVVAILLVCFHLSRRRGTTIREGFDLPENFSDDQRPKLQYSMLDLIAIATMFPILLAISPWVGERSGWLRFIPDWVVPLTCGLLSTTVVCAWGIHAQRFLVVFALVLFPNLFFTSYVYSIHVVSELGLTKQDFTVGLMLASVQTLWTMLLLVLLRISGFRITSRNASATGP